MILIIDCIGIIYHFLFGLVMVVLAMAVAVAVMVLPLLLIVVVVVVVHEFGFISRLFTS